MMVVTLYHIVATALLAVLALQTLLNALLVPRLRRMPPPPPAPPRVAVLIPARNEAERIAACVSRWTRQEYPTYEVFVFDDESTDGTGDVALRAGGGGLRVIRGRGLPDGWRGKAHACHELRAAADADLLVFADADVFPEPSVLARIAGAFSALRVHALSVEPTHVSANVLVRAFVGIQNWAPLAFVPRWLSAVRRQPLFAVTNGQLFAIRASVYDAAGGFAEVRGELGEDAAFGRRLVALGYDVALVDGDGLVRCVPYGRLRDVWPANVKNLPSIFFGSSLLLLFCAFALTALYLAPVALLALGLVARGAALALPAVEIALGVGSRAISDRRAGYPAALALLHPVAVAALIGMALDATFRMVVHAGVEWRGRRYEVRERPG